MAFGSCGREVSGVYVVLLAVVLVAAVGQPAFAQITFTDPKFSAETVATLPTFSPVGVAFASDGRLFVWQRQGLVRIVKNGALLSTPFVDIQPRVNQYGDRGLLGLALDPDFALNGRVYLLYTYEAGTNPVDSGPKTSRLTRVTADPANPDRALPGSEVVIIDNIPSDGWSHSIGTVRVAPDGTLFVSTGDGASYSFPDQNALRSQNLASFAGKVLRVKADGAAPGDNPFDDGTNSIRSRVWAYGLRNPFRFALHPTTGEPYIGDVGWNAQEEFNRGRGANFGWPCWEGPTQQPEYQAAFPTQCAQVPASAVTPPLLAYSHSQAATAIAGAFYTGSQYPSAFQGNLFIADYTHKWIRRMVFDGAGNLQGVQSFAANVAGPVAIEQGPDGLLYIVEFTAGRVTRIRYNGPLALASATPTAGYSPLTVQFSSAGSQSPSGSPSYLWSFGDGSTSTAPNPSQTYTAATVAAFTATLTITEPDGASSSASVPIVVGSLPPTPTIATPTDGAAVFIGQTILYQGSAMDPEQGALPPSALGWTVLLHHNTHVHPVLTSTGSSGSFVVTDHGEGTFSYEVILTATDASGLRRSTSASVPVNPQNLPYPTSVTFDPGSVVGGNTATGAVTLSQPAPAGGLTVSLASSSGTVQVPSTASVPQGSSSATFTAATSAVTATTIATVTASLNGSVQGVLTVNPPASVVGLTFSPTTVVGGALATGTVTLGSPASGSGATVSLSSSHPAVQVPLTVTVPAGNTVVSFVATTSPVATNVVATVSAVLNGTAQATIGVDATASATAHVFSYASRSALLGDGWDFVARTASGGARDTEQTGALAIDYDQAAHPGVIRVPLGSGELWEGSNNSQNMLFRSLPADWTSVRLKIAAFAPAGNYQQVGLIAYQDDDTYINVQRNFNDVAGGPVIGFFGEANRVVTRTDRRPLANGGNLILRLDRNPGTNAVTAFYSTDNAASWVQLTGTVTQALTNPRLAIQVGANVSGLTASADLAWVEIVRAGVAASPAPTLSSASPSSAEQGQTASVTLAGSNFNTGLACSFGAGITVSSCTRNSSSQLTAALSVAAGAATGPRTIVVTNPDGQSASLASGFSVTAASGSTPQRVSFAYASRAGLLADGWDFIARTATGGTRNTEQTAGLAIDYDQVAHPGVIRVPVAAGELWEASNDSRNTLFRDLPSDWSSIRLKIAAFSPSGNYMQVSINAYVDDDNYVNVQRNYNSAAGGPVVGFFKEAAGVHTRADRRPLSNTGNLVLRLDRDSATDTFTAYYSTTDGASWVQLSGTLTQALVNPRLAIQVGANTTGAVPVADLAWVEIQRPGGSTPTAPTLSGASPASGVQGQSLNVILSGTNFATGVACAFGADITVSGCTRDASSQLTAAISIAAAAAVGPRTVTVTNPDGQAATLTGGFSVTAAAPSPIRLDFTYADRSALLADGWDFIARTATGGTRNTEGAGGLAIDYSQTAHPGRIRIPLGPGELWQGLNDSENTLFRDLPADWVSIRLKIASFSPAANYQQVGLVAYQDDDNYVDLNRVYLGGPILELFAENGGVVAAKAGQLPLVNSGNLILRLDRDPSTNAFTAFYSLDDGATWTAVPGSVTTSLSNPRLAIQVGNDLSGTRPAADLAWVEIVRLNPPAPTLLSASPTSGAQGQALTVTLSGSEFNTGATCAFGAGITVSSCARASASQLTATISIAAGAAIGARTVTVTNPDGQSASLAGGFTVTQAISAPTRIDFTYPDRIALLADGWDFVARTATGGTRNTEQAGGFAINYDQVAHPGAIRVPVGPGELWQTANDSRNTLFRDLPADWTSVRLKIAAFSPVGNYHQVGLIAYQDDDTYVNVQRNYNSTAGGPVAGFFVEVGGTTARTDRRPLSNTGNLILRLDRNPATNVFTAFYSTTDGASWVQLTGAPSQPLLNPRLAIQIGANITGTIPNADLAWIEIHR